MTNQASELFELCKEVWNRTAFDDLSLGDWGDERLNEYGQLVPLYNSDYLLEKLPAYKTQLPDYEERLTLVKEAQKYNASYGYLYRVEADTPLKALLKLTIALSEAGELK